MKLTIGMACYDDFDGVWLTIQSIKQYHGECIDDINFIVVDGNPGGRHGKECESLVSKLTNKHGNNGLYIQNVSTPGTSSRNYIFEYAKTPYVLCIDSHVMIAPGGIKKLISYFDKNSNTKNLLQGPLMDDDNKLFANSMLPEWEYNMYGKWLCDKSKETSTKPYEVEMMGLGLFACVRKNWLGFNKHFRGFGGEEGYIHKKYKKSGAKTLILPWLKWNHRFARPNGVPYVNDYFDRIKNYMIGWAELGENPQEIIDYYSEENTIPGQERAAIDVKTLTDLHTTCKQLVQANPPNSIDVDLENQKLRARVVNLEMKLMELMMSPPAVTDKKNVTIDRADIDSVLRGKLKTAAEIKEIETKFTEKLKQKPMPDAIDRQEPVKQPSDQ